MRPTWVQSIVAVMALALAIPAFAHNTMKSQPSPAASVTQSIGMANVTIAYCRPGVKGRTVYGEMVKYGALWSPGANEATTFEFEKDALIDGNPIPAGKYSFHTIPAEDGEWTLIFNKNATLMRSLKYDEAQDALRIKVKAEEVPSQERLLYGFEEFEEASARAFMHFGPRKISFKIETVATDEHAGHATGAQQ